MSSPYKKLTPEELDSIFSNYLLSSWSYSKVTTFARNEKYFEMSYIFGVYSKSSSTTIAGQAYHHALQYFFTNFKDGVQVDLVELEQSAFGFINEIPANRWKIQKTTPTIEDCMKKAYTTVSSLLRNFIGEMSVYTEDIAEIVDVELRCEEFLTVNGVDIPLPCHAMIDLVIKTKSGRIVVVDHKSKTSFTSEDEMALSIGIQAITYVKAYEEKTGRKVDGVWFVENKHSKNKDNAAQLNAFKLNIDLDSRRLYEALLYEPLKRMIEAISNPDYVYLINESDNYVDKAELYDFWCRTMICEVEDFNVEDAKKELVSKRLKKIRDASITMVTPTVIKKFQENASQFIQYDLSNKNMSNEEKIVHALRAQGILVEVAHSIKGFSSDTFLLDISAGVSVKSLFPKRLDIANALDVENVRMSNQLVKYNSKSYLSVEISKKREMDLIFDESLSNGMKIPIGKDNFGNIIYWNLDSHSTTNALVCGSIGSGKSVLLRTVIEYAKLAGVDEIIIFDPKYEFNGYHNNMDCYVYNDILEIEEQMANMLLEMEGLIKGHKTKKTLLIFDEFADAFANSRKGADLKVYKDVFDGYYANGNIKTKKQCVEELNTLEENLRILLQKGRSSGYRVLAATQRASAKIITGDAKVNFPVQICFRVPKEADSRVVLDEPGAEALGGMGDGLIKSPDLNDTVRFQAFYKPANAMA